APRAWCSSAGIAWRGGPTVLWCRPRRTSRSASVWASSSPAARPTPGSRRCGLEVRMAPETQPAPGGAAGGSREPAADATKLPSFETAIERLEVIVGELEGGALTLEESIARYEEGMRLTRQLTRGLEEAEKRIERLIEG